MLCSRFLKHAAAPQHGIIDLASERFFDGMLAVYDWGLKKVLKHRFVTLMASLAVLVATIYLFMVIPKGFIANQDTNAIFGFTEGAQDISFDAMIAHQQAVAGILAKDTNVEDMMSSLSSTRFSTPRY